MNTIQQVTYSGGSREISFEDVAEHVGPGWTKLLRNLVNDLFNLGWDGKLFQIKEKFGGLRFYIGTGSDAVFDRINKAEEESERTCEMCGEPGYIRNLGWLKCLCDTHAEEWKNKRCYS